MVSDRTDGRREWDNLHQGRRCRRGLAHGFLMLFARGGVDIDGDSARDDLWCVVQEVEIAGDAANQRNCGKHDEQREPATVQPEAAAGKPEPAHGVSFNDAEGRAVAADGEAEEQGAAGLPAEIESPTHPERSCPQVCRGKHETEGNRDKNAGCVCTGLETFQQGIEQRVTYDSYAGAKSAREPL